MLNKLNRKVLKRAQLLRWATFFIFITSFALKNNLMMVAAAISEIAIMVCLRRYSRCPHCGAFIPGINAFERDAGICHKCNEEMEFDS